MRYVCNPNVLNPTRANVVSPGSSNPIDFSNSSASASSKSANSASVLASKKIASAGFTRAANSDRSVLSPNSAASTLNTYKNGLAVKSCNSAIAAKSTLLPRSN